LPRSSRIGADTSADLSISIPKTCATLVSGKDTRFFDETYYFQLMLAKKVD